MKTTERRLVDMSKITIDPNLKPSRLSPSMEKKIQEAREMLKNVDLSKLNIPNIK